MLIVDTDSKMHITGQDKQLLDKDSNFFITREFIESEYKCKGSS